MRVRPSQSSGAESPALGHSPASASPSASSSPLAFLSRRKYLLFIPLFLACIYFLIFYKFQIHGADHEAERIAEHLIHHKWVLPQKLLLHRDDHFSKDQLKDYYHIISPFDCAFYKKSLQALINSVVKNTKTPEKLFFHFIVIPTEVMPAIEFVQEARNLFPNTMFNLTIWGQWKKVERHYETVSFHGHDRKREPHNLSRVYLSNIFPQLEKILSLDADQLMNVDIKQLWEEAHVDKHPIAVIHNKEKRLGQYILSNEDDPADRKKLLQKLDLNGTVFSAGMFVANLTIWRNEKIVEEVESWAKANRKSPVFLHTLKKNLFNIVFQRRNYELDAKWEPGNCEDTTEYAAARSKLLMHFSGRTGKPWFDKTITTCPHPIRKLWFEYFHLYHWRETLNCQAILKDVQVMQLHKQPGIKNKTENLEMLKNRIKEQQLQKQLQKDKEKNKGFW